MSLLTYTTFQEVRAVLGVSSTELPDATLLQPMHDTYLVLALEDVAAGVPDTYATLAALAVKTADQKRFISLVELFAPYSTAKQLLTSLPLFTVQSLTDGRAGFNRQNGVSIYDSVREDVKAALGDITARLKVSYYKVTDAVDTSAASVTLVLTVAALRSTDPVTNV